MKSVQIARQGELSSQESRFLRAVHGLPPSLDMVLIIVRCEVHHASHSPTRDSLLEPSLAAAQNGLRKNV